MDPLGVGVLVAVRVGPVGDLEGVRVRVLVGLGTGTQPLDCPGAHVGSGDGVLEGVVVGGRHVGKIGGHSGVAVTV